VQHTPPRDYHGGGAIEIDLGQVVTGETPGAYYIITLDTSDRYVVSMESVPEEMLTSIKVNGDTGNDFAAETEASATGELASLRFDITEPGMHYVEISELEGRDCGPFTFEVARDLGSKVLMDR
jgi:hypothetical protein